MENLLIEEIIQFTSGKIIHQGNENLVISNISTDSRLIDKDDLFVPLIGSKFNGHDYINDVIYKDVNAIIVDKHHWETIKDRIKINKNLWIIAVNDTLKAYQNIAKCYLKKLNIIKIAITGSNGKTTTKEILKSILSAQFSVIANEGNLNNQIGVPKTVFNISSNHEIAIIEMGSGKKGDISNLAAIVEPNIGIITSVGLAHIEFLGDIRGVAEEKKGLFCTFNGNSLAILNEDDGFFSFLKENINSNVLSFSLNKNPQFHVIENLGLEGFYLKFNNDKCHFKLGGEHNLVNLSFAILVAKHLKMPDDIIAKAIENIYPFKMRTEKTNGKYVLIKDCYNANPDSMKAGLNYFSSLSTHGKKISVLGDMLELGSESENIHEYIGKYVSTLNIDYLITMGHLGKKIAEGAKHNGFLEQRIFSFCDHKLLLKQLINILETNDIVYFKASRGVELEKIALEIENLSKV
ncbi:MAG: UDP-N-acetylmuramoyl-tripeptide--D-alanyl-D-alanine ligase [Spirochaetota bacterium]|nr:UDP-N-acetylmuramoyl-tripeptide--D-alanyl-D-alanine ligase [Spirochaetota bacterium]